MLLEKGRYIYDFSLEAHKDIAKTGVNGIIARRFTVCGLTGTGVQNTTIARHTFDLAK